MISVQIVNKDTQSIESNGKETEHCDFKCEKPLNTFFCDGKTHETREHILHEKKLKKVFFNTVKRVQNNHVASYQTFRLKERFCKRFRQQVFHRTKL